MTREHARELEQSSLHRHLLPLCLFGLDFFSPLLLVLIESFSTSIQRQTLVRLAMSGGNGFVVHQPDRICRVSQYDCNASDNNS